MSAKPKRPRNWWKGKRLPKAWRLASIAGMERKRRTNSGPHVPLNRQMTANAACWKRSRLNDERAFTSRDRRPRESKDTR